MPTPKLDLLDRGSAEILPIKGGTQSQLQKQKRQVIALHQGKLGIIKRRNVVEGHGLSLIHI